MADAGPTFARMSSASCWRSGIQGGFQRRSHLHLDLEEGPAAAVEQGLPFLGGEARLFGKDLGSVAAAQLRVVLLLQAAGARGVPGLERPAGFLDLFGIRLGCGAQQGAGEGAGGGQGKEVADGAGAGNLADLIVGDGPAVLAQGDGGDEGLRACRLDLLGVRCGVNAHQLGELRGGRRRIGGSQQGFVDADVHDRPVGDQLGVTGAQDLRPRRGLGQGAEDFTLGQPGDQRGRVPDGQPLVAGLLQLGGGGVLPFAGADLPAVVQRDRGGVLLQRQLAAFHRGFDRVQCLEYLFELLIGRAGVLALKRDGADVERRDSGRKLLRRVLRAGAAVVAGHQRAAKNETNKDS